MNLEEEVIELTDKWTKYVSSDYHKDRDCHWHITKTYSYGEEPYYEAHHSGYLLDYWISRRCSTEEMASIILRDKLKAEIKDAINNLNDMLENKESLDWIGQTKDEIQQLIKALL